MELETTFRDAKITPTNYRLSFTMVRNDRTIIVRCLIDIKINELTIIDAKSRRNIYGVNIFEDALRIAKELHNKVDFETIEQPFYIT